MSVMGVSYRTYRVWQRGRDVVFRLWFAELLPPLLGPLMVLTALGLGLMIFARKPVWIVLGVAVLAAPHVIGAPQPDRLGGAVPPELAAHFVAASLVTAAVFWTLLGWLSGTLYRRFS